MIIECQTCHARFRLDESKIKGRGARVKCRKCGDGIIVLKDGGTGTVLPEGGPEGGLDLSSALRDSAADLFPPAAPPPSQDNLIPFPAPPRDDTPPPPMAEGKDEVDLAFDRFLAPGEPHTLTHPGEPEAGAPAAPESSPGGEAGLPAIHAADEEPAFPPVGSIVEPPPEEPPTAFGEGGFLLTDSETLDFLKEGHRVAEPPPVADISFAISADPIDLEATSLREPAMTPAPPPEAEAAEKELPIEGNVTPPGEQSTVDVPPFREAEPAPDAGARRPPREAAAPAAPAPSRPASSLSPAVAGAAVLLAVALVAAGYLGLTPSGRKTLESVAPGAAALLGGGGGTTAASRYEVTNVIGYYESGASSRRILVIKGQVANQSSTEKSGIRILAALQDAGGKTLAESSVYAGNTVSVETLKKGNREAMIKSLSNPLGDGLANMHVPPGKSVPFMVLFFDAPENIDSYRLEARDNR
ncbi:MAG: zinc-ribbon domain-containing protein [Deltaproteobacteria bacterium]|nr:zinc-ribbon domain-containing protein [Deltaproteobacteria bacterium]